MAASFLDTLSSIIVTKEDIIEAEQFSRSYLSSIYPDLDLREGVALSDLVIRPTATLIAMVNKGMSVYFANNNVAGITDETPEADVDRILSNFFITRNEGTTAIVRARLYFLANNRDIYIAQSNNFSLDNSTFFNPQLDEYIPSTSLIYDGDLDEYYVDINLESSVEDSSADVSSGDLIYHTNVDPYFVQAKILYQIRKPITTETNTQMVNRTRTAISTRNLINNPSILSAITSTFNYFTKVVPIGMGDPEMFRDLIEVIDPFDVPNPSQVNVGGKVDVYVNCEVNDHVKQYTVDDNGAVYIVADDFGEEYVVFSLDRASLDQRADEGLTDTVDEGEAFTVSFGGYVENPLTVTTTWQPLGDFNDVGLSTKQVVKVQFADVPGTEGKTVSFAMRRVNGLISLQNYLDDSASRVVCADYLARSLEFYHLTINILKVNSVLTAEEVSTCTGIVENHLSDLQPGEEFIVSNLVQQLVTESGITNLDVNLGIEYILYDNRLTGDTGTITVSQEAERTQFFVLDKVTSEIV